MYYTIEGKRVLGILYIAGLITGTLFFNITIKMQVFKVSDFLDFTEYMKMLENIDLAIFCSYVVFVRFRQLLLFFVGLFLFSPYIVFCLFDYGVSVFTGILISAMVLKYGLSTPIGWKHTPNSSKTCRNGMPSKKHTGICVTDGLIIQFCPNSYPSG